MTDYLDYKAKGLIAFLLIVFVVAFTIWQLDSSRKSGLPPKISVEPESLSLKLNASDMVVRVLKVVFDEGPVTVESTVKGPGLANVTKLKVEKTDVPIKFVNNTYLDLKKTQSPVKLEGKSTELVNNTNVKEEQRSKEYFLYVNVTNPIGNKNPLMLEGYISFAYNFPDPETKVYEKLIPLKVNITITPTKSIK
jgi:hypothetical protein